MLVGWTDGWTDRQIVNCSETALSTTKQYISNILSFIPLLMLSIFQRQFLAKFLTVSAIFIL